MMKIILLTELDWGLRRPELHQVPHVPEGEQTENGWRVDKNAHQCRFYEEEKRELHKMLHQRSRQQVWSMDWTVLDLLTWGPLWRLVSFPMAAGTQINLISEDIWGFLWKKEQTLYILYILHINFIRPDIASWPDFFCLFLFSFSSSDCSLFSYLNFWSSGNR